MLIDEAWLRWYVEDDPIKSLRISQYHVIKLIKTCDDPLEFSVITFTDSEVIKKAFSKCVLVSITITDNDFIENYTFDGVPAIEIANLMNKHGSLKFNSPQPTTNDKPSNYGRW